MYISTPHTHTHTHTYIYIYIYTHVLIVRVRESSNPTATVAIRKFFLDAKSTIANNLKKKIKSESPRRIRVSIFSFAAQQQVQSHFLDYRWLQNLDSGWKRTLEGKMIWALCYEGQSWQCCWLRGQFVYSVLPKGHDNNSWKFVKRAKMFI